MPRIELVTDVPAPRVACFDLSLSVDAHTSSMAGSGERAIGGIASGVMKRDDEVTWRATHFGIPFTMTSRITEYRSPTWFVDEQVAGPFRRWRHEHLFEQVGAHTVMTDRVEFVSPAGPLGRLVNTLVLTRYMTHLLRTRNAWLVQTLAAPGGAPVERALDD